MPDHQHTLQEVAIVGTGLIGASFGLGLRKAGFKGKLIGVDEDRFAQAALAVGAIDEIATLAAAAARCQLLYLAGTVHQILQTIEDLDSSLQPGCLVTDVGSTKVVIEEKARRHLSPETFVGGHPLAGKEKRGAENAEPNLFRDRPYILTSPSPLPVYAAFVHWLEAMGARVMTMNAAQHDATVAFSSHLPQLAATALAYTLASEADLPIAAVSGNGLADMTRLAMSEPGLWKSILDTNQDQIRNALDRYIRTLSRLKDELHTSQAGEVFEVASKYSYFLRSR